MNYRTQKKLLLCSFLFLPMALMVLFLIYPTIRMVFYGFTNWDGVLPAYKFIGINNFIRLFTEPVVWLSLKNNAVYIFTALIQNIVALFFAVILVSRIRAKNFYKVTFFITYILNMTAVAYMFNYMYDYREGPIDLILKYMGLQPVKFLSDTKLVIFSLAFISFWRFMGYTMVIYIAALQSVETELYEYAKVDGASGWQTFWRITLPSINKVVELNLFLTISGSLQAFGESLIMTKGGPGNSSYTFLYYILNSYTRFNDYGYAAAMSTVLVAIIVIVTLIQNKIVSRGA